MAASPYAVQPEYTSNFKSGRAKEVISAVLRSRLEGKEFNADLTTQWTKEIADEIKMHLKGAI
jgi:hypothetical protein